MRCKVIQSAPGFLEEEVNDWLSTGKYEIINILQTQDNYFVTITIFYLEKNEIREKKLKKLNKINKNDTKN